MEADTAQSHNLHLVFSGVLRNQSKNHKHRKKKGGLQPELTLYIQFTGFKKPEFQSLLITANRKQPSPPHYFHFSLVFLCLSDQSENISSHCSPTSWALLPALGSTSSSRVGHGFHLFQNTWDPLSKAERGNFQVLTVAT